MDKMLHSLLLENGLCDPMLMRQVNHRQVTTTNREEKACDNLHGRVGRLERVKLFNCGTRGSKSHQGTICLGSCVDYRHNMCDLIKFCDWQKRTEIPLCTRA